VIDLICFKAYDIRGGIGVNIDEDIAYRTGHATAQHLKAKTVVIGFDARETSPDFAAATARGVMDSRSDVLSIGMSGTEEMYWAVQSLKPADNGALWVGNILTYNVKRVEE